MTLQRRLAAALALPLAMVFTNTAKAQHVDILAYVQGDHITTARYDFDSSSVVPGRIFVAEIDGSDANGYATSDPGFNAIAGYTLPASVRPSVRAVTTDFLPRNLSYWDGSGAVSFGALPNNEKLYIGEYVSIFWQGNTVADGSASASTYYSITTATNANGTYHKHISFLLRGENQPITIPAGTGDDFPNEPPSIGFYLVAMELSTPTASPAVEPSDPFFIIFNRGGSEAAHDEAVAWLEDQLSGATVPEPASLALLLPGIAWVMARRRKRR